MNDYLKYAAGAALFLLWAILVFVMKLDPSDLIATIKIALFAILGFVGVTKLQAANPSVAISAPADATIAPPATYRPLSNLTATTVAEAAAAPTIPLSEGPK